MHCSIRCWLLFWLCTNFMVTITSEIFDFLGYMWLPIAANFMHLLVLIFATFGAAQLRPNFLLLFLAWVPAWIAWNVFVICFYLEIGTLRMGLPILNLDTGSVSFWYGRTGCQRVYNTTTAQLDFDCMFHYRWVEIGDSCLHIFLIIACAVFTLTFLLMFSRKAATGGEAIRRRDQPRITMELADNPGYHTDTTGYLNETFDSSPPMMMNGRLHVNGVLPASGDNSSSIDRPPPVIQNYHRRSKNAGNGSVVRNSYLQIDTEDVLSQPSRQEKRRSLNLDRERRGKFRQERHTSLPHRSRRRQPRIALSASELDRQSELSSVGSLSTRPISSTPLVSPPPPPPPVPPDFHRTFSGTKRPFKHALTPGLAKFDSLNTPPTDVGILDYTLEPRRRGGQQETQDTPSTADSVLGGSLNALISFDPKSNTIVRYHDLPLRPPTGPPPVPKRPECPVPPIPVRLKTSPPLPSVGINSSQSLTMANGNFDRSSCDSGVAHMYSQSQSNSSVSELLQTNAAANYFMQKRPSVIYEAPQAVTQNYFHQDGDDIHSDIPNNNDRILVSQHSLLV